MARSRASLGDDFLETLRSQADMVRLVSDYVSLKKAGRSWKGLCPFHREKTPSFSVDEAKGLFYCFGCRTGGDIFSFLMKLEGLSFPEAVRVVAERSGIEVPADRRSTGEGDRRTRLLAVNRRAADWFRRNLWASGAEKPRHYLEQRGLGRETLEAFAVGYALPGWDNLLKVLRKDFRPEEIEAAGLALPRRRGDGHYDRFRDRIVFPIRDLRGNVVGFGGRVLPGPEAGDQPKYLNTPETEVYNKGKILYGMEMARAAARRSGTAVLVEGYTDVLALHAHGIEAAVGVCGTALTPEQASLLARFADVVHVNFDGDAAGRDAAARGLELLLEAGIDVRAVLLPSGSDPDTFLRQEGAEAYRERLEASSDLLAFFLESAAARGDLDSPRGKLSVVEEILPVVARVPDRILRSEFASRLAERLRIEDGVVLERVRRAVAEGRDRLEEPGRGGEPVRGRSLTRAEGGLLQALLEGRSTRILEDLTHDDVAGLAGEEIFRHVLTLNELGVRPDWGKVMDRLEAEEDKALLSALAAQEPEEVDPSDCLRTLRRMQLERRLRRVQHAITAAERAGDHGEVDRLAMEKLELTRQMRAV